MICPYCAEEIKDKAIKCKHCHEMLYDYNQPNYEQNKTTATSPAQSILRSKYSHLKFPLELKGIIFNKNNFVHKGITHDYNNIKSLLHEHRVDSQNGINVSNNTTIRIKLHDNNIIKIFVTTGIFSKKNRTLIAQIYDMLYNISFDNIAKRYIESFVQFGYVDYEYNPELGALGTIGLIKKTARIYNNGNVKVGKRVVNLQVAREKGFLILGTEYGWGFNKLILPSEISMAEKKNIITRKFITINAKWDKSIIFNIIKQLSEGKKFS